MISVSEFWRQQMPNSNRLHFQFSSICSERLFLSVHNSCPRPHHCHTYSIDHCLSEVLYLDVCVFHCQALPPKSNCSKTKTLSVLFMLCPWCLCTE